jgi:hypothetical protein
MEDALVLILRCRCIRSVWYRVSPLRLAASPLRLVALLFGLLLLPFGSVNALLLSLELPGIFTRLIRSESDGRVHGVQIERYA